MDTAVGKKFPESIVSIDVFSILQNVLRFNGGKK